MIRELPYQAQLHPDTIAFLQDQPKKLLINGQWVAAASGKTFAKDEPSTGLDFVDICAGDADDVNRAVAAARAVFDNPKHPWRRMTPHDRERLIHKLADLMEAHREELGQLITLENGKPIAASRDGEVVSAIKMFRYYAGWPTKIEGDVKPVSVPDRLNYTLREPVGVVGAIVPWNYPLDDDRLETRPALALAIASSSNRPSKHHCLLFDFASWCRKPVSPTGVVQLINGMGETAGAALVAHAGIDKIAFTGSTEVGKIIARAAAGNVKRLSLELGGKSPHIIFDDADVGKAVIGAAYGIFANAGQACNAGSRLFVQRKVYDEVLDGMAKRAASIKVGAGLDKGSEMGPLVSREQYCARDRLHEDRAG